MVFSVGDEVVAARNETGIANITLDQSLGAQNNTNTHFVGRVTSVTTKNMSKAKKKPLVYGVTFYVDGDTLPSRRSIPARCLRASSTSAQST